MVGELGPELVALPRGSRIYNDHETKNILGVIKDITQHITINTPTPLTPAETARQIKNASRQLALRMVGGGLMDKLTITNQKG
jgi:hypothetical protein